MVRYAFCVFLGLLGSLSSQGQTLPIDPKATAETKNLYINLQRLSTKGVMFGHQDDLAYGVGWQYQPGRSDIKDVVGEYPAVFGWDLGRLELDSAANLDKVPFDKQRALAQQAYAQGGVNTYSWHLNNPLDLTKTSWDKQDSTIRRMFNDRKALKRYTSWLKKVAVYMKSLKGPNGEAIPVIFRPFHEHTGSWFWWGKNHCSPAEYVKMWRYTVDYLRKKKVHNLLYAYSTDRFTSREDYLERYPGDDYVDIVGFDIYHRPRGDTTNRYVPETRRMVETLRSIGQEKRKVWAMTETGLAQVSQPNWWTNILMPVIQNAGLSYVLVWRNEGQRQYFAPFQGQASADDFKAFYANPNVLFGTKTAAERLYAPNPPTQ
ncbi:glycoside hydrolase family 26 protein [Spirosoma soli]|uniref:Mannan endo-1,4-beta-mannosidase n=1 Tax=Spirosoma soli TaxID=1770529 RepID=A0ABW5M495_9BACT